MKHFTLLSSILFTLALAACGESAPQQSESTTATPASAPTAAPITNNGGKTYRVVSQASYPPFATRDEKGQTAGLDYDLLNAIAAKEGFSLTFIPHGMEGLLETLDAGDAEIVATGVNITPEREEKYTFSKPYLEGSWAALSDKRKATLNSFADLQGKAIAAQSTSLSEKQLKATGITDKIVPVQTIFLGISSINQDEAVAVYDVDSVLNTYLKSDSNLYTVVDEKSGKIPFGWVMKKGNTELKAILDKGIDDLKADGTYQKILDKWYPSSTVTAPVAASAAN